MVELLFDPEAKRLGVRAASDTAERPYPVRQGRRISGRGLLSHYGIPLDPAARRRPAVLEDGVLVVDLTDPGVVVTSNRAKREKP